MINKKIINVDASFIISIFFLSIILFYPEGLILESFYAPGDETTYKSLAIKIVEKKIYAEDFDNLRSWRPPGYPFYLSLFYFTFGDFGFRIIPYANFALYIVSYYFIFRSIKLFFKETESFLICLIVFLFHFNKFNQVLVINYSETLFFFFLSSFFYLFVRSLLKKKHKSIILSFFILGLSYMVRGPSLPLGITIIIFFSFFQKTFSKKIIFLSLFFFLVPSIYWMTRNYYILGFGPHMYTANYILIYYGLFDFLDSGKIDELSRGLDDLGKINTYKPLIIEKIKADYVGAIILFVKKFLRHFYYHNTYLAFLFMVFSSCWLYFNNSKKIWSSLYEKKAKLFLLCLIISIIFLLITSVAQFSWRYSLVPSIFFLLFSNCLFVILFNTYKK